MKRLFKTRTAMAVAVAAWAAFATQGAQAKEFFRMSTLGPGTTPYMLSTTFATLVNKQLADKEIQVNATGAGTQHAIAAAKGDVDLFVTASIVQTLMSSGKAMFAKVPSAPEMSKKLRLLFMFPAGVYHFVAYEKSGIKTIKDIKGKKVFIGPKGSAINRVVQAIITASTGYVADKDYEAVQVSYDAGDAAFQDERVDAYINITNPPSPVVTQVALTNKIRILTLGDVFDKPEMKKLYATTPGRFLTTIPVGIYGKNQMNTEPVRTLGAYMGIACREGLSDDDVYAMLKIFWGGLGDMAQSAPWLKSITMDSVFASANMPLHPGAVRFYKEKGIAIPQELMPPK